MHGFTQNFLVALLIGAEVFAIAALWPLSDWAARSRKTWPLVVSMLLMGACLAPNARAMLMHASPDSLAAHALEWIAVALLLVFPDAVCVASAQSLARAGMPARWARGAALGVGAVAVLIAPLATVIAGCGLVGACW